jgi:hypothetical protein
VGISSITCSALGNKVNIVNAGVDGTGSTLACSDFQMILLPKVLIQYLLDLQIEKVVEEAQKQLDAWFSYCFVIR